MTAEDLKRARAGLGVSQPQLARMTGYSRSTIDKAERGERPVPRPMARIIALLRKLA